MAGSLLHALVLFVTLLCGMTSSDETTISHFGAHVKPERCHTGISSKLKGFHTLEAPPDTDGLPQFPPGSTLIIPVRYVIILGTKSPFDPSLIDAQHLILNECFEHTAFHFDKWEVCHIDLSSKGCKVLEQGLACTHLLWSVSTIDGAREESYNISSHSHGEGGETCHCVRW